MTESTQKAVRGWGEKLAIAFIASIIPVAIIIFQSGGTAKQVEINTGILKTHIEVVTVLQDAQREENAREIALVKQQTAALKETLHDLKAGQDIITVQNARILARLPQR